MADSHITTQSTSAVIAPRQRAPATIARLLTAMVLAALVIRLLTMLFLYPEHLDPRRHHWHFAWEMGMVARSIVTGKGFSSPYEGETGPTAWFPPVYPCLLAGVFQIFGLFSKASAIVSLSLNCVFSALTTVPIFFIARRTIGERVARLAGWIWVFFPYAIFVASSRIWENALTTLLLSLLVWWTLRLDNDNDDRTSAWIAYGSLWGLAALTNPAVLAVLPFLLLWIAWRRDRRGQRWLFHSAVAGLMIVAVVTPWTIRNYRVFHKFMPLRSNFWVEVRVGNTGDISDIYPDWAIPSTSAAQWNELHRVGETAYIAEMRDLALRFIRDNPGVFAWLTWKRFVFVWTGFWNLDPAYADGEPFQIPNTFFCSALTLLMLGGLVLLWRHRREWILPYAAVLGAYPAVYYITHPGIDYRHPIDPMLVILVAYAVLTLVDRRRSAELNRAA
ncbi:MAG: glycosyltransferase family 39 protein [Acidobacteriia bacterium]|nr:glycosyltransferase family 39 protein [Terriglobia bacterium]